MTKIIENDNQLRKYIPNVIQTINGEQTLFEKLSSQIEEAELWAAESFTGETLFNEIAKEPEGNVLRRMMAIIVCNHAFMQDIPSLDLVLTPNGFGIVSNANIAPASKDRVERLIASLEKTRDNAIN